MLRPTPSATVPAALHRGLLTALAVAAVAGTVVAGAAPASARGLEVGGSGNEYRFQDSPGGSEAVMYYGRASDNAVVGDWNGDRVDTTTVRRGNLYYVNNAFKGGEAESVVAYGRTDDVVLVGDWDGDGVDTLGVRRGNLYHLKNSLTGGEADIVLAYGRADDVTVVGDWDGDGRDTLGVHRNAEFHLANSFAGGPADTTIALGRATDQPLVGDWDRDRRDDVAVRRDTTIQTRTQAGRSGQLTYGTATDRVFAGDWNGDGRDTFALRRPDPAYVSTQPMSAARMEMVIQAARSRIGGTYVFGASGPTEFDCSGLTSWAYRRAGIYLPHQSGLQPAYGVQVSPAQARPGDLIWWPGHVAIYTGNGRMIDAASPALGISERPIMKNPTFYRLG